MIVDDFHLLRAILPHEADPKLIVNPDAPLPRTVSLQRLQPVTRRALQLAQALGLV
jgi:hypothetical protein